MYMYSFLCCRCFFPQLEPAKKSCVGRPGNEATEFKVWFSLSTYNSEISDISKKQHLNLLQKQGRNWKQISRMEIETSPARWCCY